jgi:DNA-binding response OmpR family regulator
LSGFKPKVLIVEDEPIIAMMLEEHLLDAGCEVAATAMSLEKGLALAQTTDMDLAILDMSLGSQSSFAVADVLASRGIPFMFASGFGSSSLPEEHRGRTILNKPFHFPELVKGLTLTLGGRFIPEQGV